MLPPDYPYYPSVEPGSYAPGTQPPVRPRVRSSAPRPSFTSSYVAGPATATAAAEVAEEAAPDMMSAIRNAANQGRESLSAARAGTKEYLLQPGGLFKTQAGDYRRAHGGRSAALLSGLGTFAENPVAGTVSTAAGVTAGGLANTLATNLTQGLMSGPGPAKAAGMAIRFLAPALVGTAVEQGVARGMRGTPQQSSNAPQLAGGGGGIMGLGSSLQDFELTLPFLGKIPIGERAQRRAESAYQREQRIEDVKAEQGLWEKQQRFINSQDLQYATQAAALQRDNQLQLMRGMAPIIADAQRRELTGQQALLNTQGAIAQRLTKTAGMVQLLERGMAEAGAMGRAQLENSPYKAAMMPLAPYSFN